jgi:hypothetical protein
VDVSDDHSMSADARRLLGGALEGLGGLRSELDGAESRIVTALDLVERMSACAAADAESLRDRLAALEREHAALKKRAEGAERWIAELHEEERHARGASGLCACPFCGRHRANVATLTPPPAGAE